jgi:hypothetical protein
MILILDMIVIVIGVLKWGGVNWGWGLGITTFDVKFKFEFERNLI